MNLTTLERLDNDIQRLTLSDQVWLLEQLARHIREQTINQRTAENALEAMAADPDIQRELRTIADEFGPADSDGLTLE